MSHKLIDLNEDLRQLREEGYNISIEGACLVVRDIPYVNEKRVVCRGIFVCPLDTNGDIVNRPSDHTMKFAGEYPSDSQGRPIEGVRHQNEQLRVSEKLTTQLSFSSKPPRGHYLTYREKVRTYDAILSAHAAAIDPTDLTVTARTFRVVEPEDDDLPFHYLDTASARAGINMIARKLVVERLAIIGLGGTGSYVLDLLAKTPAKEIHLFDGDKFSTHNAFRAPGAASKEELHTQPLKVDYFKVIYSRMHKGIVAHGAHVDESNVDELRGMACVFLCVDGGLGKRLIVERLEEFGVPFIDVGIGLYEANETLGGIVRVTTSESGRREVARARMSFAEDTGLNEYEKNIQVADLNALNAALAVLRWKKMRGFYFDLKRERYTSYTIGGNLLLSEDLHEPD